MGQRTLLDKVFKGLDHNRYTAIGALLASLAVGAAGCQATSTSPYTGERATRDQIELDRVSYERELLLAKARRESEARRRVDAITAAANAEIADLTAELGLADQTDDVARMKLDAQATLAIADIDRRETVIGEGIRLLAENPYVASNPLLSTAVSLGAMLFAGGVSLDNRRKNAVMAEYKAQIKGAPPHAHATDGAAS